MSIKLGSNLTRRQITAARCVNVSAIRPCSQILVSVTCGWYMTKLSNPPALCARDCKLNVGRRKSCLSRRWTLTMIKKNRKESCDLYVLMAGNRNTNITHQRIEIVTKIQDLLDPSPELPRGSFSIKFSTDASCPSHISRESSLVFYFSQSQALQIVLKLFGTFPCLQGPGVEMVSSPCPPAIDPTLSFSSSSELE